MQRIEWFEKDDFYSTGFVTVDGVPQSLAGVTLHCQGLMHRPRMADYLHTFTIQPTAVLGEFAISATKAEAALWPVGEFLCDVLVISGSSERHTHQFVLAIKRSITRAP